MIRVCLIALFTAFSIAGAAADMAALTTKTSPHSVADTVMKFTAAVEGAGAKVFAVVDHAAGAKSIGADIPGVTVVIFGNPKLGTPLIKANPAIGIDLPMKMLVWDDGGATKIGYADPQSLKAEYDIEGADKVFAAMAGALNKLTDAAIKSE